MSRKHSKYLAYRPQMVRHLRNLHNEATADEIAQGLAWYRMAQQYCAIWEALHGIDANVIACVVAAISPQCRWEDNVKVTDDVLRGFAIASKGGALPVNIAKARRALNDRATGLDAYFADAMK